MLVKQLLDWSYLAVSIERSVFVGNNHDDISPFSHNTVPFKPSR